MAEMLSIKPGQVLYTVSTSRMGNTLLRTVNIHEVKVIKVADDMSHVVASWNGNPPEKFHRGEVARWRTKEPITIKGMMGQRRLARRDEIKAIRAKHAISPGIE